MIEVPVRVKDALREGCYRKNYRMVVYQADGETIDFTIDNNNLINESVQIDERMCSDSEIKFGLCEGTYLDFQCFDTPNITGRRLKAYIDVEYKDEHGEISWYPITLGWFDVKKCSRNPDTGRIKISCYNKLLSDYLNNKANDIFIAEAEAGDGGRNKISIGSLLQKALDGYTIDPEYERLDIIDINPDPLDPYYIGVVGGGLLYGELFTKNPDGTYTGTGDYVWLIGITNISLVNSIGEDVGYIRYRQNCKALYEKAHEIYENSSVYGLYLNAYGTIGYQDVFDFYYRNASSPNYDGEMPYPMSGICGGYLHGQHTYALSVMAHKDDENITSEYWYGGEGLTQFAFPVAFVRDSWDISDSDLIENHRSEWEPVVTDILNMLSTEDYIKIEHRIDSEIDKVTYTVAEVESFPDVTLREFQSAVFETQCQFGRLDRETDLFYGMELNNARLLPAEDLYPANDLYPISLAERVNRAMYEKLWCDEGQIKKFRYLIITYKTTEEQGGQTVEVEKTLQRTVDEHGTDNYNCSNNWLFRNLVWTAEQIGEYADAMAAKMRNITWFPFELWCAGLPYIETGDEMEINMNGNAYTSYVLKRNLTGIQDLHDEMMNGNIDTF